MRNTFSKNLIIARKRKGYSQAVAAYSMGIDVKRYAKYEEGIEPSFEVLQRIVSEFGIRNLRRFLWCERYHPKKYHYLLDKRRKIDIKLLLKSQC